MAKQQFPLPVIDGDSKIYWESCKNNKLMIQKCEDCGQHIFYPRQLCPHCMSENLAWVESSGKGIIYSYTVVHRPRHPAFMDKVPYVVALITLEEGVRMMSNIINIDVDQVRCGMPVEVVFEPINDEITLPKFQPIRS